MWKALLYVASFFCVLHQAVAINRDGNGKSGSANVSTSFTTPYAYYDYDRDPRQWIGTPYAGAYSAYGAAIPPLSNSLEAIAIGLLIALGLGIIGFPVIILLFSLFLGNTGSAFNFIPPATTTTVTGRKRRDTLEQLFPQINPQIHEKILGIYEKFTNAPDKLNYLRKLLDS